ncbi:MAG: ABC transporter permease [Candidatus Acidiferrales bacterium]
MRYLARRVLHGLALLVGVSLLSFLLLDLAPGDFFDEMRLNPEIAPETVAHLRAQYGLDRPLAVRYWLWARSAMQGEFGYSFAYDRPVSSLLWPRAANTLLLGVSATLLAWLLAIPIGIWSATQRGTWKDRIGSGGTSLLLALPELMLALLLLWIAVRSGLFPTGGMSSLGFENLSFWGKGKDLAAHLFLPATTLALATLPVLLRHVRSAMIDALNSPCLLAARGRGIPRMRLLLRYALPLASNSLISLFGLSLAGLLSASLIVEVVMSWPGLGPLLLEAVMARDIFVVVGAVLFSAAFLFVGNLLADILLYLNDPRIRMANA